MDAQCIIVGGGIAGMSCARKLKEDGVDVLMVTEELGGRVCYDADLHNNFGAVFCMENYDNAFKILDNDGPLEVALGSLMLHTSPTKQFKGTSLTMMASIPQLLKFRKFMNGEFIPEYSRYKRDCETMPAARAFEKHPAIRRYYDMRASELIEELGIQKVADNFISKFAYACTGSRVSELNALDFLNVAQGVIVKLYNFTFDPERFTKSLDGRVVMAKVESIEKAGGSWRAACDDGRAYEAPNIVVATTGLVTQRLLGIDEIRQPTKLVSYLVKGTPNAETAKAQAHYFGDEFDVIAIARRTDGLYNVYSRDEIDLGDHFDDYEVVKYRIWPEALFTYGNSIMEQDFDEGCYIASDVNGLGVEPAAISGIYAANRILGLA